MNKNSILQSLLKKKMLQILIPLMGRNVILLILLSIPLGVLIGLAEFALGAAFYNFLIAFKLVPANDSQNTLSFLSQFNPIITLVSLATFVLLIRFLAQLLPNLATEYFQTRIRLLITERTLKGAVENSSLSVSDVSNILANYSPRSANLVNAFSALIISIFLIFTILVSLVYLSLDLTVICITAAFVFGIPLALEHRGRHILANDTARHYTFFTDRIVKDIRHLHFIKVNGVNEAEYKLLTSEVSKGFTAYIKWLSRFALSNNLPTLIGIIFVVGLVYSNDKYSIVEIGTLVPFLYLISRLAGASTALFSSIAGMQNVKPYVLSFSQYIDELFNRPRIYSNEDDQITLERPQKVSVSNLAIGRGEVVSKDISFNLSTGENLVVCGMSGKGKTTLLMTLIGLLPKMDGEIIWNSTEISDINPSKFRSHIGYAGPDPFLFDGTLKENLLFGVSTDPSEEEIWKALEIACADHFIRELPGNLDFRLQANGAGISAGQQQRVALARALLRNPAVLLMDEATANIDEDTEEKIMQKLNSAYPDLILLAISHRSSMRKYATRFLELN